MNYINKDKYMNQLIIVAILPMVLLTACGASKTEAKISEAISRSSNEKIAIMDIDSNSNGIRDDIDEYIDSLRDTPEQKQALKQTARAFNIVLSIDIKNKNDLNMASEMLSKASSCIFNRYSTLSANKRARQMEKYYMNTPSRMKAYDNYNQALNGIISISPMGSGCED